MNELAFLFDSCEGRLADGLPVNLNRKLTYIRSAALGGSEQWQLRSIEYFTAAGDEVSPDREKGPKAFLIQPRNSEDVPVTLDPPSPSEKLSREQLIELGAVIQLPPEPRSRQIRQR